MKTKIAFLLIGAIIGSGGMFLLLPSDTNEQELSVFRDFTSFSVLDSNTSISCTFPQVVAVYYQENQIEHALPTPESNPMVFTFSDFNTMSEGLASLSYVDASESITSVALGILHEDDEKLVLMENGGESYLTTYTIFKKQGVAIFSKQILFPVLGGVPSGTTAMGTCR